MNKVVKISDRLKGIEEKKREESYRKKVEALQGIVRCSSCQSKCAMCGCHLDAVDSCCSTSSPQQGLHLCESCSTEFEDFLKIAEKKKDPDIYWHNREWVKLWAAWLSFHQAIGDFRNTTEYRRLIKEL